MEVIDRAHQMYREGSYEEALGFYTDALAMAKTKVQRIALHSNRAACYLKLHHFNKAADECTSVLELDHKHTGALMLRAQTLVTLKEYQSALFDVNRLLELNPQSEVYLNLQARLKTQLSLAPIPESEAELEEEEEDRSKENPARENDFQRVGQEKHRVEDTFVGTKQKIKPEASSPNIRSFAREDDRNKMLPEHHSKGWVAIPKPKGHSKLDYSRWDAIEDDSGEDGSDDEETQPQYRFRVKTLSVRPVK